jgi:hypothetical protein
MPADFRIRISNILSHKNLLLKYVYFSVYYPMFIKSFYILLSMLSALSVFYGVFLTSCILNNNNNSNNFLHSYSANELMVIYVSLVLLFCRCS